MSLSFVLDLLELDYTRPAGRFKVYTDISIYKKFLFFLIYLLCLLYLCG